MIRVHPQPPVEHDGWLRLSALVEGLPGGQLWFDVELRHAALLTSRADPWPLALLFAAMQTGAALAVDGEVSSELLTNLETVQETWRLWAPDRYRAVAVSATSEVDAPEGHFRERDAALMVFGGGLDDCYTAMRHARRLAGRQTLALRAGLMVIGVPIPGAEASDSAIEAARVLLGDLGLDPWTMRTNAASFVPAWEHASGAVRAACLHWFSGGVAAGVLAAAGTVTELGARSGSHPLIDPWLGSDRMRIVHDGAEQGLLEKAATIAAWSAAVRRLGSDSTARGVLSTLALAAAGAPPADQASEERTAAMVGSLTLDDPGLVRGARAVLGPRGTPGRPAPWREPLRESLARAQGSGNGATTTASEPGVVWAPIPRAAEIHVFPEPPVLADGRAVLRARVEGLVREPRMLWFSVEAHHGALLTPLADPFACALQFPAMRAGAALVIHGPVSRVLLRNLDQFQRVWHAWAPQHVTPVAMRADREVEGAPGSRDSLMLFSGGLDSSFSVYRHHRRLVGRRSRRIAAGLMVLGFDIAHHEVDEFHGAFENSRRMLESLSIELWGLSTNFRDIVADWEPGHGTGIAACIHCFGDRFQSALVAATASVASFGRPWGTHILTDRMLGSDRVQVVTDGADNRGRLDKASLVAEWPEAMSRLRVCHESPRRDRNCGTCTKCVMTSLIFLANGLPLPSTLRPPDPEQVHRLLLRGRWEVRSIDNLLARARDVGVVDQPALLALPECVRRNEARWSAATVRQEPGRRPLWRRVRGRLARELRQWGQRTGRG